MDFLRRHRVALLIFSLALIARVFLLYVNLGAAGGSLLDVIHGDDGYYELSQGIMEGKGLEENPLRTPLYPGFIAFLLFVSGSYSVVIGVQIIVGALIPVLGRQVALRITGIPMIGLVVGLVLAFDPYFSLFSSIFYTETLFIFLFLAFILLFLSYVEAPRWRTLALSALVLGVATLTKPTAQYLPVFITPFLLWHLRGIFTVRRRVIHAALFIGIFLLVLSPWLYRNYRVFGAVGMTAQPAYNLYVYLVPSVLALERGSTFAEELEKNVSGEISSGNTITLANSGEYSRKALLVLKDHPKGLLLSGINSGITFFTHDGLLMVLQHAGLSLPPLPRPAFTLLVHSPGEFLATVRKFAATPLAVVLIARLWWITVTALFVIGSIIFVRRHGLPAKTAFAFLLILYFLVTTPLNGLGVNARFRMPVAPLILTFAAYPFFRKREETIHRHSLL